MKIKKASSFQQAKRGFENMLENMSQLIANTMPNRVKTRPL
jgi:hypothetical protein